jgi:hypothetical protein
MRRGRSHRRPPLRPGTRYPPPPPDPERDGGCDGHAFRSGPAGFRKPELPLPGAYQPSRDEPARGEPGACRGVKLGCCRGPAPPRWSGSSLYHPRGQSSLIAAPERDGRSRKHGVDAISKRALSSQPSRLTAGNPDFWISGRSAGSPARGVSEGT